MSCLQGGSAVGGQGDPKEAEARTCAVARISAREARISAAAAFSCRSQALSGNASPTWFLCLGRFETQGPSHCFCWAGAQGDEERSRLPRPGSDCPGENPQRTPEVFAVPVAGRDVHVAPAVPCSVPKREIGKPLAECVRKHPQWRLGAEKREAERLGERAAAVLREAEGGLPWVAAVALQAVVAAAAPA